MQPVLISAKVSLISAKCTQYNIFCSGLPVFFPGTPTSLQSLILGSSPEKMLESGGVDYEKEI